MDRRNAHDLTLRLSAALDGRGMSVETVQANAYAGGDSGYVTRVHRPDGTAVDIIGAERSGYQITDRALGWQSFDLLAAELCKPTAEPVDEPSPVGDADLVDRLTAVASTLRGIDVEVAAIRDELRLRAHRVTG